MTTVERKPFEAPSAVPPRASSPPGSLRGAQSPTRVLVVDDEPALRRSLARLLQQRGFEVLTAEDGPAAFTLLATTRVDVMMLDLMMPTMTGMEVLERVKREYPTVEVVMMTAFGDVDTAVTAVRAGAYNFLTK